MEEQPQTVQPKPRHRWLRLFLILALVVVSLFTIGCYAAKNNFDEHMMMKAEGTADSFCTTKDEEAPEISLIGNGAITLKVGEKYEELGATAIDSCEEVEVVVSGAVDTNTAGTYKVTYSSMDSLQNTSKKERVVNVIPKYHGTIYLTFDDGPSQHTALLLDILKKYDVKATFFVTGYGDDAMIVREYNEGHAIGLHTASHDYSYVYQSTANFFADLYAVQNRVKNLTGYTSMLMRFPGGSSNTVSTKYDGGSRIMTKLVKEVTNKGFVYFDWNISSGDAGNAYTPNAVFENVVYAFKEYGDSIVLQHDSKGFSVEAVEKIIQFGLANGYEFKKLDMNSPTAHHRVNN